MKLVLCLLFLMNPLMQIAHADDDSNISVSTKDREDFQHQEKKGNDIADTRRRNVVKETKNANLDLKEQACREVNGKLECAGSKTAQKIKNEVE